MLLLNAVIFLSATDVKIFKPMRRALAIPMKESRELQSMSAFVTIVVEVRYWVMLRGISSHRTRCCALGGLSGRRGRGRAKALSGGRRGGWACVGWASPFPLELAAPSIDVDIDAYVKDESSREDER
jgi:hypothetical protein